MRLLIPAVLSGALLLTGCSAGTAIEGAQGPGLAKSAPDPAAGARIEGVQTFPYVTPDHQAKDYAYPQKPPVGGDHWPPSAGGVTGWLACGRYDREVPDEFAVHSMEHGAVWLTYRPGTPAEQVAVLAELAGVQRDYVLVTPYAGQPGAFGATTWGAQLFVESPDDPRLEQFVRAFAGGDQGREPGAPCAGGTSPEDAQAALDAVSSS
ncbi:MAG: hypothetical protein JWN08_96 [Frankiales bacterium]|nr:hypothetical protein [Frankiales bacterium]